MRDRAATPASAQNLTGELADLARQVRQIKTRTEQLLEGLDDRTFTWRPESARWSIAECLDHLNITADAFFGAMDKALETGKPAAGEGAAPPKRSLIGGWIIRLVEPPPKRRFKAPQQAWPRPQPSLEKVVAPFFELQDGVIDRLHRAQAIDLWKTKLRHPAIPLMRFSLGEMLALMLAHERRHLWQAEQVRQAPGFPGKQ